MEITGKSEKQINYAVRCYGNLMDEIGNRVESSYDRCTNDYLSKNSDKHSDGSRWKKIKNRRLGSLKLLLKITRCKTLDAEYVLNKLGLDIEYMLEVIDGKIHGKYYTRGNVVDRVNSIKNNLVELKNDFIN